jgi:hypothetical protein
MRKKGISGMPGIPFFILESPLSPICQRGVGRIKQDSNLLSKIGVFVYDRNNKQNGPIKREKKY